MRRGAKNNNNPAGVQLGAATLIAAGLCLFALWSRPTEPLIVAPDYGDTRQVSAELWSRNSERRVYPLSVVPGGVYSAEEADQARRIDPIVDAHYVGINVPKLRRVVLEKGIVRFVSFRRGNQIYWTRRAMPIPQGEAVLADGDSMVRARCGNRLSEEPREPVLPIRESQPTAAEFEVPVPAESAPPILVASAPPAVERHESVAEVPAATAKREPSESVPRFGGFNVLGGGLGGRVGLPSQNPALSGNSGISHFESLVPVPSQVSPQLSPSLVPLSSFPIEGVYAILTPLNSGGTRTYTVGLPVASELAENVGRSSGILTASTVREGSVGSRPGGSPPAEPNVPFMSSLTTQNSSISAVQLMSTGSEGGRGFWGGGTGLSSIATTDNSGGVLTGVDTTVPEPRTTLCIGLGLVLLGCARRKRID